MKNKAKEYFKIEYSGSETDNHELTVRELAPSLLAFADFIEEANKAVNGDKVKVELKFRASREGSIIVELAFAVDLLTKIADFFRGDAYTAIWNLKEVIGITSIGLFRIIKWIKNREIKKVKIKDEQKVILILEDEEQLEISDNELKVLRNIKSRKALSEFSNPIKDGSANAITIFEREKDLENGISESNIHYFKPPNVPEELINESKQNLAITIDSLAFKEDNKWRVSDGDNNYTATMSDESFRDSIKNNLESFRHGDILRIEMITRQYNTEKGLKTEHEILKVKEHIPPADQLDIDFEE